MDFVTIASTGNAIDFGDLTANAQVPASCSNAASAVQPTPTSSAMALFAGGLDATTLYANIDYVNIATTGDVYIFGNLSVARSSLAGCASSTRGLFGGGNSGANSNVIDYVTFASASSAIDFGDLTVARYALAACSSETRGVFGGGETTNVIDYVTIASTGNATDFGDLTRAQFYLAGCSSTTRGLFGGGNSPNSNIIDYITIASTGNAIDFGDLTIARYLLSSCSSSTRGVFAGGLSTSPSFSVQNVVDYVTIASTGNATDFGDLTVARYGLSGASSSIRGVFGGGNTGSTYSNVIDYIAIASTGNAVDFGDLASNIEAMGACSNAHGGL
jgi:hypothetical protein